MPRRGAWVLQQSRAAGVSRAIISPPAPSARRVRSPSAHQKMGGYPGRCWLAALQRTAQPAISARAKAHPPSFAHGRQGPPAAVGRTGTLPMRRPPAFGPGCRLVFQVLFLAMRVPLPYMRLYCTFAAKRKVQQKCKRSRMQSQPARTKDSTYILFYKLQVLRAFASTLPPKPRHWVESNIRA